ncbi:TonB-dependent receptor (plasmid) [Sphingomonas paeninsulae]|uniref:TonB-dependent receptor n=1 Tax=Sphingomonas paeninsulae TaxID=2319844 RepID=A0A494TI80_SPHPE|nr:TonB-dependent receptor [Sphingomonas paeninsulae]AYJ85138.1 TonB-dependent receptor [Sphingomonas paeninsulae]
MRIRNCACKLLCTAASLLVVHSSFAQTTSPQKDENGQQVDGEIIVTARKRLETAFDAPVVLQAVSGEELGRRSIVNVEGLSRITPLLLIGENTGGVQGAPIAIRGIAGSEINPFSDQAVSFNIDGIQVARSSVQRLASMDVSSVEILKGPQALFFGKNSPGGVISIRSADATAQLEMKVSAGYEFNAHETRLEGYVSGPITETLGVRVAGYFSGMRGYIENVGVAAPGSLKSFGYGPQGHEFAGRVTLKYSPDDRFSARFKFAYGEGEDTGSTSTNQISACSGATPQLASIRMDCQLNGRTSLIDPGPAFQAIYPTKHGGRLYSDRNQLLSSLELNFTPVDNVTITSLTGVYRFHTENLSNTSAIDIQSNLLYTPERVTYRDINQELRVLTTLPGFINVSAGGMYQSGAIDYNNRAYFSPGGVITSLFNVDNSQRGKSYSLFGQLILKPANNIELSGGGRYSHEDKRLRTISRGIEQISAVPADSWSNFSPEVTLKWSATPDINLFASYRRGFLSGGFNGSAGGNYTGVKLNYDQQTDRGGEIGLKARLFDKTLRLNLALFDYDIRGLQVAATTGVTNLSTNAGKAYTRGVELDGAWTSPLAGLTLRGAVSYDKARYEQFTFACYKGQSVSQGCNLAPVAGVFTQQNLAGQAIVRAPEWGGSGGFNYENISRFKLGLSGDANYSGGYFNNAFNEPLGRQKPYWLFDASARIGAPDGRWELALIGRNLSNKYYLVRSSEQPFSGGPSGSASANRNADIIGAPNRGREVMVQLTFRLL